MLALSKRQPRCRPDDDPAARMRFIAPSRSALAPETFDHPVFAGFSRHRDLLLGQEWPGLAALDARLAGRKHPLSGVPLRFVAQTPELLADGSHYEQRIFERGEIATRTGNWHDLLNAIVWIERLPLKATVNARYVADLARAGPKVRTRGQCALTLFDEGGAIVLLRDRRLLEPWDAHDWEGLFWQQRMAWTGADPAAEVIVFGHALLEHALAPRQTLVAKATVVLADDASDAIRVVADAIAAGTLLGDPQELRPLPLCGIPGWHADSVDASFYRTAPCFRPLRPGRTYPSLSSESGGL